MQFYCLVSNWQSSTLLSIEADTPHLTTLWTSVCVGWWSIFYPTRSSQGFKKLPVLPITFVSVFLSPKNWTITLISYALSKTVWNGGFIYRWNMHELSVMPNVRFEFLWFNQVLFDLSDPQVLRVQWLLLISTSIIYFRLGSNTLF